MNNENLSRNRSTVEVQYKYSRSALTFFRARNWSAMSPSSPLPDVVPRFSRTCQQSSVPIVKPAPPFTPAIWLLVIAGGTACRALPTEVGCAFSFREFVRTVTNSPASAIASARRKELLVCPIALNRCNSVYRRLWSSPKKGERFWFLFFLNILNIEFGWWNRALKCIIYLFYRWNSVMKYVQSRVRNTLSTLC